MTAEKAKSGIAFAGYFDLTQTRKEGGNYPLEEGTPLQKKGKERKEKKRVSKQTKHSTQTNILEDVKNI